MEEVKKAGFPAIIKTYSEELNQKQHVILEQCRKFRSNYDYIIVEKYAANSFQLLSKRYYKE